MSGRIELAELQTEKSQQDTDCLIILMLDSYRWMSNILFNIIFAAKLFRPLSSSVLPWALFLSAILMAVLALLYKKKEPLWALASDIIQNAFHGRRHHYPDMEMPRWLKHEFFSMKSLFLNVSLARKMLFSIVRWGSIIWRSIYSQNHIQPSNRKVGLPRYCIPPSGQFLYSFFLHLYMMKSVNKYDQLMYYQYEMRSHNDIIS